MADKLIQAERRKVTVCLNARSMGVARLVMIAIACDSISKFQMGVFLSMTYACFVPMPATSGTQKGSFSPLSVN